MLHVGVLPNHRRWAEVLTQPHARRRSTRRTPIAASSARTSRSCCDGCGASARSTAASRSSCSRARRSPTPREACAALTGLDVRVVDRRRRAARAAPRGVLGHAAAGRGRGHARLGAGRGRRAAGGAHGARPAHDLLRQEPQGERARLPLRAREPRSRPDATTWPSASRPTARATRPRSAGASRATSSRAGCSASSPPRRSSWAWTSACSTARWPSASRGRSRACASSGAVRAAAARVSRCSCRAPTRSIVTSSTIRTRCSGAPNEAAILDPTNPEIRIGHLRAAAHELPLTPGDDALLGAGALEAAEDAGRGRRARAHARRARLARLGLARRAHLAALGLGRCDRGRRAGERHAARDARAGARLLDGARGRRLPAPRRDVPRGDARPRRARRARLAVRRPLVHPAAARDRDEHRRARCCRGAALRRRARLRRGRGVRSGRRLRAAQPARAASPRHDPARPARAAVRHARALVRPAGRADGGGRRRPARRPARRRARAHLGAAADRDVRPLGHRRALDEHPSADAAADGLRLRRPRRRRRHRAARLRALRRAGRERRARRRASAAAATAARRACSRPSAATSTRCWTRAPRRGCCRRWPPRAACRSSARTRSRTGQRTEAHQRVHAARRAAARARRSPGSRPAGRWQRSGAGSDAKAAANSARAR